MACHDQLLYSYLLTHAHPEADQNAAKYRGMTLAPGTPRLILRIIARLMAPTGGGMPEICLADASSRIHPWANHKAQMIGRWGFFQARNVS
jgi:hypothetical protein